MLHRVGDWRQSRLDANAKGSLWLDSVGEADGHSICTSAVKKARVFRVLQVINHAQHMLATVPSQKTTVSSLCLSFYNRMQ